MLGKGPRAVNLQDRQGGLGPGYAPRTINHALSVVSGFYEFHARNGNGPLINPVPAVAERPGDWHIAVRWSRAIVAPGEAGAAGPAAAPRAMPDPGGTSCSR